MKTKRDFSTLSDPSSPSLLYYLSCLVVTSPVVARTTVRTPYVFSVSLPVLWDGGQRSDTPRR